MDMHVDPQDVSFMSSSSLDPCAGFMPSDVEDSRRDSPPAARIGATIARDVRLEG